MKAVLEEYGSFIVEILAGLAVAAGIGYLLTNFSDFANHIADILMGGV